MSKTKNQCFSQAVFERVTQQVNALGQGTLRLRKYKGLCKRSGGMLRTMGLIQYLTFMRARGQRQTEIQYLDLLEDLRVESRTLNLVSGNIDNQEHFLANIRSLELPKYMYLTREVLRLLDWHKRLADVLIQGAVDDFDDHEED